MVREYFSWRKNRISRGIFNLSQNIFMCCYLIDFVYKHFKDFKELLPMVRRIAGDSRWHWGWYFEENIFSDNFTNQLGSFEVKHRLRDIFFFKLRSIFSESLAFRQAFDCEYFQAWNCAVYRNNLSMQEPQLAFIPLHFGCIYFTECEIFLCRSVCYFDSIAFQFYSPL